MNNSEQKFIQNIYTFAKKKMRLATLGASIYFIVLVIVLWLSLILADQVFYFSEVTRWGLLAVNILIIASLVSRILNKPFREWYLFKKDTDLSFFAEELTTCFPEGHDGFVITYQLIKEKEAKSQVSTSLRQAAIDTFISDYARDDFRLKLKWTNWIPSKNLLFSVLATAFLLSGLQSNALLRSTMRILNPSNQYLEIPAFRFEITPGNTQVVKGKPLQVLVRYQGPAIESCILNQAFNGAVQQLKLTGGDSLFSLDLKDLHSGFTYWISAVPRYNSALAGYLISETYQVRVLIPPRVEQLDLEIEPPRYTKRKPIQLDRNIGDVLAYPGSKVHLRALVNKNLESAHLEFSSAQKEELDLRGKQLSGSYQVRREDTYKVILKDTTGLLNQNPISYQIALLTDHPPFVAITEPGMDTESPLDGKLHLQIEAEDDFALSKLEILYHIQSSTNGRDTTWTKKILPVPEQSLVQKSFTLDFNRLPLTFGDTLKYFARVWDNNGFAGPASAESRRYLVLFPSLDELFAELDQQQDQEIDALDAARKESENLRKELEKIERQMSRDPKMDWDKKQSLEKILKTQKELQKQIQEMRQELEEAVQKLEKNNLLSPEIMEKYNQLQEMFQEVLSPELLQSLQKLQQALEQNRPQDMRQALKQFKLNQEAFEKSIERTMELLKRVQFEQKMDRLVKKAEQLAEQQQKISAELKSQKENSIDEQIKKMQQQQQRQQENLSQDAKDFMREELLEKFPQTKEIVDTVQTELQKPALQKKMTEMSQQLAAQQTQQAQQNSEQLQQSFEQMHQQLQQAQKNMQQQSKNQIAQKMQRISRNLLDLSFQQEQIQNQTRKTSPLGNNFNQNLKDQGQALNNFDKVLQQLAELSKETFFLPSKMSGTLRTTRSKMQQSLAQLSEREKGNALRSQGEAMRALNETVLQMSQAMSQMMKAQSGTGFEEFMRQMQQMAAQQGQLNDQSLQLMQGQGNKGMYSQRDQAELKRLGQGQSALRQALDQLAEEMGQRDDVLGELKQIGKDMELVEKDLLRAQPDRRTVERQQRILSRMLDSQRSLEQREFSKKRKSQQGRQYVTRDPGEQGSGMLEDKKAIEEALRQARKQGFSRDYQKLIEIYFEKLLRSNTTNER